MKKKRTDKNKIVVENLNADMSAFLMYESSYMPQILTWAKKEIKNKPPISPQKLINNINKVNRNFLCNIKPSSYKNLLIIMQAIHYMDKNDYLKIYKSFASEFKNKKTLRSINNIDERMRVSLARLLNHCEQNPDSSIIEYFNHNEEISKYYFNKILQLVESKESYCDEYEEEKTENVFIDDMEKNIVRMISNNLDEFNMLASYNLERKRFGQITQELMVYNDVVVNDFLKMNIPQNDMKKISRLVCTCYANSSWMKDFIEKIDKMNKAIDNCVPDFNDDSWFDNFDIPSLSTAADDLEEAKKNAINNFIDKICMFVVIYKIILLYKEARNIANKTINDYEELKIAYEEEKSINKKDFERYISKTDRQNKEKEASLLEVKQKQLNELQLKYDKLLTQYQDVKSDNELLKDIINQDEDEEVKKEDTMKDENEPPEYPQGTVLFGGHENWQRKFAQKHPEVRIINGFIDFPENVVSPRTPLVLVNACHFKHKFFYKVRRLQQRQGWELRYIK